MPFRNRTKQKMFRKNDFRRKFEKQINPVIDRFPFEVKRVMWISNLKMELLSDAFRFLVSYQGGLS